jgi:protein tyrosine/serine phosphatase
MNNRSSQPASAQRRSRLAWRRLGLGLAACVLIVAGYAGWLRITGNFHPVAVGEAYRAGQMSAVRLERVLKKEGIHSVVNLRGPHPEKDWYRAEVETTDRLGVVHRDFALSSGEELSADRIDALARLLRETPKPVLIHCEGGSDRTAFASALYAYAIAKRPAAVAERQLAARYGHLPWLFRRTAAMDHSFWRYVGAH